MKTNNIFLGDSHNLIKEIETESIHLIVSDIPYGIGIDDWDVLHSNTNSAYLGSSPAQMEAGAIFKKRGKPLNGWSEADKLIPKQYYDWVMSWSPDWFRVLMPGASAFVFAGRRLAHRCICAFEDSGFIFKDMIAWDRKKAAHRAQRLSCVYEKRGDLAAQKKWEGWKLGNLRPRFEPILWFTKPYKIGGTIADNVLLHEVGAYNEGLLSEFSLAPDNIITLPAAPSDTGLHPTQKPLKLMEILIGLASLKNQIVLDPFCGSGTTLLAALRMSRQYIGFEKEKQYYDIATKRINDERELLDTSLFDINDCRRVSSPKA